MIQASVRFEKDKYIFTGPGASLPYFFGQVS